MNSSSPQMHTAQERGSGPRDEPRRRTDHPRAKAAWKFVLWLAVVVVAVAPFPWW